jgi:hypothetical protein
MATYLNREAARYNSLAEAARDNGKYADAEYLTGMAERYIRAAHEQGREQEMVMRQEHTAIAEQKPRSETPEQPRIPLLAACFLAALRVTEEIVTVLHPPEPKGLSLR